MYAVGSDFEEGQRGRQTRTFLKVRTTSRNNERFNRIIILRKTFIPEVLSSPKSWLYTAAITMLLGKSRSFFAVVLHGSMHEVRIEAFFEILHTIELFFQ